MKHRMKSATSTKRESDVIEDRLRGECLAGQQRMKDRRDDGKTYGSKVRPSRYSNWIELVHGDIC